MKIETITKADNLIIASIIRKNLKSYNLDIPGTAYFDENLDNLSEFYLSNQQKRVYLVLKDDYNQLVGGVGLSEFEGFDNTCELQKLYLDDAYKGLGYGIKLVLAIEEKARKLGYLKIYLETHDILQPAINLYKKLGYKTIEKPNCVAHSAMNLFFIKDL